MYSASIVNDAFSAKVKAGMFACVRRSLAHRPDGDDRYQEGLAQTWAAFRQHHDATGTFLSDGALVVLCRRRAWSRRDHFVPRPRGRFRLDVFEALTRRHAEDFLVRDRDTAAPCSGHAHDRALDVLRALLRLDERTRDVALGMLAGETTREIGRRLSVSSSSVTRMGQRLETRLRQVAHG